MMESVPGGCWVDQVDEAVIGEEDVELLEVCQSEVVDEFDDGVVGDGVGVVEDREGILHEGCVKVSIGVDTVSKSGSFPRRRQARELMGNTVGVKGSGRCWWWSPLPWPSTKSMSPWASIACM